MNELTKANPEKPLTPRELTFLLGYAEGKSATDCYLIIRPDVERESARVSACRMLKRILKKTTWPKLLEGSDLGELRFIRELDARLKAVVTKHYQDKVLGVFEDNGTRMRATELLGRVLGKDKQEIDLCVDVVEIIPPPKPPEDQGDGRDLEEGETP